MIRAVLDACVIYSASLRDLFMRLTVNLAFQPIWTDQIHEEWMRNVLINRPDLTRDQLERTRVLMDRYGRDWEAPDYETLIPSIVLPDAGDRHVVAAAIAAKASIIVTFNLSDFPASALSVFGIDAQHPDQFLCSLFDQEPEIFIGALRALLAGLKNPPRTLEQQLQIMRERGLHKTVLRLEERAQEIQIP